MGAHVRDQQSRQKDRHDQGSRACEFDIGQTVWARNFRDGPKWISAVVSDRVGPLSYLIRLRDGEMWRRHIDHLRSGSDQPSDEDTHKSSDFPVASGGNEMPQPQDTSVATPLPEETQPPDVPHSGNIENGCTDQNSSDTALRSSDSRDVSSAPRYPSRVRKPPDRLYATVDPSS